MSFTRKMFRILTEKKGGGGVIQHFDSSIQVFQASIPKSC